MTLLDGSFGRLIASISVARSRAVHSQKMAPTKRRSAMSKQQHAAAAIVLALLAPIELRSQWLDYPTPGIPRTPDGKPNLTAPAPKTPDGKPDISGVWKGPGAGGYDRNVAKDLKPSDIQPWAEALYQQRVRDMGKDA